MRVAQAAAVRGFRFSGFAGSDDVRACNGVYVLDEEGGQHNGHATYISLLGHRFVYRDNRHYWVITDRPSNFGKKSGFGWSVDRYVFSPVTAAGGWKVPDGSGWALCLGAAVSVVAGE